MYMYVCMYVLPLRRLDHFTLKRDRELYPNIIHMYRHKVISLLKFTSIILQLIITCKHCNKNKNQIDSNKMKLQKNNYNLNIYGDIWCISSNNLTFTSRKSLHSIDGLNPMLLFMQNTRFRLPARAHSNNRWIIYHQTEFHYNLVCADVGDLYNIIYLFHKHSL